MKKIFTLLFVLVLSIFESFPQQIVHAYCDTSICIPGSPVDLSVTVDSGNVGSILNILDDTYSQVVNLKFDFIYFGNTYKKCVLSTNAYISFELSNANSFSPWQILFPAPSSFNPINSIYGPWHDTDPSVPPYGTLAFGTFGTAPNRFFVYSFCSVPMYLCNDTVFTGQIILYEGTNIIETHTGEKRLCYDWNAAAAIHGLQDATGTVAVIVPGRNYPSVWETYNEGKRFTPNGSTYDITDIPYAPVPFAVGDLEWKDESGNSLGNNFDITVHPTVTTKYIVTIASCGFASDTVTVIVGDVPADISIINSSCSASANGSIEVTPTDNNEPYVFVWTDTNGDTLKVNTGNLSDTLDNLPVGTYVVTITNSDGCVESYNVTVGIEDFIPAAISQNDLSCATSSDGSITVTPAIAVALIFSFG